MLYSFSFWVQVYFCQWAIVYFSIFWPLAISTFPRKKVQRIKRRNIYQHRHHHHLHHRVHEVLGMFSVPWSSRWSWSLHLFLGRPIFLRPFGLYCSASFGILLVSILCTCRNWIFKHYSAFHATESHSITSTPNVIISVHIPTIEFFTIQFCIFPYAARYYHAPLTKGFSNQHPHNSSKSTN